MTLQIKPMLKGSSLSRNGGRLNYHVTGLSGTTQKVMWDAMFAGGLPQPEDPHPNAPGLKVTDTEVTEMLGNFDCVVTVTYGTSEETQPGGGGSGTGTIEVDSSIVMVKTELDFSGKPIRVIYNPGDPALRNKVGHSVNVAGGDRAMGATSDQFVAMVTVRVMRVEDNVPLAKAKKFVGRVNSKVLFDADDKQAWLCSRLAGTRNTSTTSKYNVTYEFLAPEDGWLRVAGYIDPTTSRLVEKNIGEIVVSPTRPRIRMTDDAAFQDQSQNGLTIVRVQGLADFDELNLPTL